MSIVTVRKTKRTAAMTGKPLFKTTLLLSALFAQLASAQMPDVLARWTANAPLAFIDQYIGALRSYQAIALDVGDQDGLRVDTGKLHDVLDTYEIANTFEVYSGTHTSRLGDRFQNHVMKFFSDNLCFKAGCRK